MKRKTWGEKLSKDVLEFPILTRKSLMPTKITLEPDVRVGWQWGISGSSPSSTGRNILLMMFRIAGAW